MIKAVFFDIDNTVYNYDKAHAAAMKELLKFGEKEFSLDPDTMNQMLSSVQKSMLERLGTNCAVIHNRLIRFQCFLELLRYPDLTKALEMNRIYWDTFLGVMTLEPGLIRLLSALRTAGILIGIGSDQNASIQYQKLEKLKILKYFSRIVTSEEAGAEKPSPEFFRLCVEKAGCMAEECAFIGDNIKKDVEGALQNGLHGIWYHKGQCKAESGYTAVYSYADCLEKDGIRLGDIFINFTDGR